MFTKSMGSLLFLVLSLVVVLALMSSHKALANPDEYADFDHAAFEDDMKPIELSASDKAANEAVAQLVANEKILVFSKSYCPYCKRVKDLFSKLGYPFKVVELDQRDDGAAIQDALERRIGRRTVPQVFIGTSWIGGSDDTVDAYRKGRLTDLFKAIGLESENKQEL
eukprot:EC790722.1.p2 GENE.EC790722.1~~EC790722.1.p2  ORF type:complete len:167 (+),score=76.27 EC790722.1:23-523(+)